MLQKENLRKHYTSEAMYRGSVKSAKRGWRRKVKKKGSKIFSRGPGVQVVWIRKTLGDPVAYSRKRQRGFPVKKSKKG